jgi:hypothetical protein
MKGSHHYGKNPLKQKALPGDPKDPTPKSSPTKMDPTMIMMVADKLGKAKNKEGSKGLDISPMPQTKSGKGNIFTKKGRAQRAVNRYDKIYQKGTKRAKSLGDNRRFWDLDYDTIESDKKLNKLDIKEKKRHNKLEFDHNIEPFLDATGQIRYETQDDGRLGGAGRRIKSRREKKQK